MSGGPKETKSNPTPPRVRETVGQEAGEKKEKEPKRFTGVFPSAGKPLPEVVLQTLFAWLRSSDLSALYASSTTGCSPGEIWQMTPALMPLPRLLPSTTKKQFSLRGGCLKRLENGVGFTGLSKI